MKGRFKSGKNGRVFLCWLAMSHIPHEPRGSPQRPQPPMGSWGEVEPAAEAVKTLSSRWVFLLLQCEQAMGLSASAMGRMVSVVFSQFRQTYSYMGMAGSLY